MPKHAAQMSCIVAILVAASALVGCGDETSSNTGHDASAATDFAVAPDLAPQTSCDLVTQDCAQPGTKCTLQPSSQMGEDIKACVATKGSVTEGQPCTRTNFGVDDNCAVGLVCSGRGTGALHCARYCHSDSECGNGTVCQRTSNTFPDEGVCAKACTLFGNDCGDNDCSSFYRHLPDGATVASCRPVGTVPIGGTCTDVTDCVKGTICYGPNSPTGICSPLCNSSHACPATDGGGQCQIFSGGVGVCI